MSEFSELEGGCLCGAVRYRISVAPLESGWCHCRMCQRHGGGPAQPYSVVPIEGFRWLTGEPKRYRSSAKGERLSCGTCGSSLAFWQQPDPAWISLNSGTLDDPTVGAPQRHIWTMSRVAWFDPPDGLPRFRDGGETPEAADG